MAKEIDETTEAQTAEKAVKADWRKRADAMYRNEPFGWNDPPAYKDAHPLAMVARALMLIDYLVANDESDTKWMIYGIGIAAEKLAKAGEYDAFGTLLAALETLVPVATREEWPLSDRK